MIWTCIGLWKYKTPLAVNRPLFQVDHFAYSEMAGNNTGNSTNKSLSLHDTEFSLWRGDHPRWLEIIITIIIWVVCIFAVLGNGLVIATFIRYRDIRNKVANLYILNLSLSDFLVGCIGLLMANLYRQTGIWRFGEVACKFWLIVDWGACFVSVWAIVLISYDRYVLVTKGLEYNKYQTKRKFWILSGITWIACFLRYVGGFIGYDLWNKNDVDYSKTCDHPTLFLSPLILFDFLSSICLPVILTTIFNIYVYTNIYKRSRGLLRVSPADTATPDGGVELPNRMDNSHETNSPDNNPSNKPMKREGTNDIRKLRRSAVTLALIVGVSAICWIPYYGYVFATILDVKPPITTILVTYYIWWSNSACNPLLFVATHPGIRNGVAKIIHIQEYLSKG